MPTSRSILSVPTPPAGPSELLSRRQILGLLAVLSLLAVACHYAGFNSLMAYDEAYFLKGKAPVFAQHDVLQLIGIVPIRPLFLFTFYLNYLTTGMDPFYFRLTNAIMLAASGLALTVSFILIFDMGDLNLPGSRQTRQAVGILLGLLFVAHPSTASLCSIHGNGKRSWPAVSFLGLGDLPRDQDRTYQVKLLGLRRHIASFSSRYAQQGERGNPTGDPGAG